MVLKSLHRVEQLPRKSLKLLRLILNPYQRDSLKWVSNQFQNSKEVRDFSHTTLCLTTFTGKAVDDLCEIKGIFE